MSVREGISSVVETGFYSLRSSGMLILFFALISNKWTVFRIFQVEVNEKSLKINFLAKF